MRVRVSSLSCCRQLFASEKYIVAGGNIIDIMPLTQRSVRAQPAAPDFLPADEDDEATLRAYPNGKSVFAALSAADPRPKSQQAMLCIIAGGGLLALPFLPAIAVLRDAVDASWDIEHGVKSPGGASLEDVMSQLILKSIGITKAEAAIAAQLTAAVYFALLLADVLSEFVPAIRWPASWRCDNKQCYEEMFCEPTRDSLVRRPGNTYSNSLYLYGALIIPSSAWRARDGDMWDAFWLADVMFGVMLFFLALLSTIWHASNAPKSQYIDLWAMDTCIAFLIVRITCAGGLTLLVTFAGMPAATASLIMGVACALLFGLISFLNASKQLADSHKGFLDGGCPFSARSMLLGKSSLGGASIVQLAVFGGMPLIFMALPTLVMGCIVHSVGSLLALSLMLAGLTIGWGYRLFERFVLDGALPMNVVQTLQRCTGTDPAGWRRGSGGIVKRVLSAVLTLAAAVTSPTAILHAFTGVTLVAGYLHARSLDQILLGPRSSTVQDSSTVGVHVHVVDGWSAH